MSLLVILKWVLIWAIATGALYSVYKVTRALVTKPNLRYYLWRTLKDVRHMYYRYHV